MPRLIALDLGSHAVKATVFNVASRSQLELTQRYQQPVPQDGVAPTFEHRLAALDALLDDTPALKPTSSDIVLLAWPSTEAAFHRVAMPFTDKAQIERTLPFAVENEVPFELEEMVLAWRIAEQQDQTYVLAALARQARVAEWLAALDRRGIDPASVHVDADVFGSWGGGVAMLVDETPTEPLVRTPDGLNRAQEPLLAIIDLGHLHTTVSVIRNATVQYGRSINVGGWTFTRAIAEGTGLTWHEAEQLKHMGSQPGAEPLAEEARTRLQAAFASLMAELRSALIKAEDSLHAEVVEVRITGGSSLMPGLAEAIHEDLGVPVRQALDPRFGDTPPEFAVAHALAYATSGGAGSPIDLRVGQFLYKGRTDLVRSALVYGVAGAACFCLAALLMFAVQFRSLAAEQAETEAAVREIVQRSFPDLPESALESMGKAEAAMAGLTQDAVQRAEVLGNGTGGVPPTVDALYHLTGAFPPHPDVTVEVSDLTITPVSISLNAETDGFQSSSKVEESLKANPRFHTAVKGQETKLANGRVRFPITIPLGEEPVAADATGAQPETNKSGEEG
jgi:type IV pilus assembly protein PilM